MMFLFLFIAAAQFKMSSVEIPIRVHRLNLNNDMGKLNGEFAESLRTISFMTSPAFLALTTFTKQKATRVDWTIAKRRSVSSINSAAAIHQKKLLLLHRLRTLSNTLVSRRKPMKRNFRLEAFLRAEIQSRKLNWYVNSALWFETFTCEFAFINKFYRFTLSLSFLVSRPLTATVKIQLV